METPEGRYGYVGAMVKGRAATLVMQSTIYDPEVSRDDFGYNWRLIRLARCEDLTSQDWVQEPFLITKYGDTILHDMIVAPDGYIYLSYQHRGGDTFEESDAKPKLNYITRIHDDLSTDVFQPDLKGQGHRLYVDSRGQWYAVGRVEDVENLKLWRLDPDNGFNPVDEWELEGTGELNMAYALRPERSGGEGSRDTVHLMMVQREMDRNAEMFERLNVRHLSFPLPVNESVDLSVLW